MFKRKDQLYQLSYIYERRQKKNQMLWTQTGITDLQPSIIVYNIEKYTMCHYHKHHNLQKPCENFN